MTYLVVLTALSSSYARHLVATALTNERTRWNILSKIPRARLFPPFLPIYIYGLKKDKSVCCVSDKSLETQVFLLEDRGCYQVCF